jgi:hypothetical protein
VKILIFNQDWFAAELRELGHEVVTCGFEHHLDHKIPCGLNQISTVLSELAGFAPDVILWHDNSMPSLLMAGLEECPIPTVLYSVDTHHHAGLHSYIAGIFDHVMVAQRDYLHLFKDSGTPTTWLPLWAPRFVEASEKKTWTSTFVGNLDARLNPRRVRFFEELAKVVPIHIAHGNYWEIFPFAEIVVNQTVKGDLNFRVFEAMMSGALLLTENTPNGLLDIFEDGRHLITYTPDNVEEASEKIASILSNPIKMREIARAGREEILAKHTATSRTHMVDSILRGVRKRLPAKDRHFITMVNYALTSFLSVKRNSQHCPVALSTALLAAQAGCEGGQALSDMQAGYLIRASVAFDALTQTNVGAAAITLVASRYPQNNLLALANIRNLLNSGRRPEAEVTASAISNQSPQAIFKVAEDAVQALLAAWH